MRISIIIPNYNGQDLLKQNLPKVLAAIAGYDAEVIVVDDASTDQSLAIVKQFPVKVVAQKQNGRFARAINAGVAASTAELVYLLNSDAYPNDDFLKALLPHFADPTVFAVGSKSGGTYNVGQFRGGAFYHQQASDTPLNAHVTLWASGGMAMMRRDVFRTLGGMDPLYAPFYWEDIDLSYRAWKRGYKVLWEPNSVIVHAPETTNRKFFTTRYKDDISERNHLLFIWKNLHSRGAIGQNVWYIAKRCVRQPRYLKIMVMAVMQLPKVLRKRAVERREQKVSDAAILGQFV